MTFFNIVSGRDPYPTEQEHISRHDTVEKSCESIPSHNWISLPRRFGRIIIQCTKTKQNERWDLSQIEGELSRLSDALENPDSVSWADMLTEELMARTMSSKKYQWSDNKSIASIDLPSGFSLTLRGNESASSVTLKLGWLSSGEHSRKRVQKWLPGVGANITSLLKDCGWSIIGKLSWSEEINFEATIKVGILRKNLSHVARCLHKAHEKLRFE
jgi:hypothetical protein